MSSEKIKAYIQLSRPANVLITFASIAAAVWIAAGTEWRPLPLILAALTGAVVAAGANAINDVFDIEIDRINRPGRPLPRGILTSRQAQRFWVCTSVAAVCMNILLNPLALIIAIASIGVLYYYSAHLKRSILAGNIAVSSMTAMAFIYGGAVSQHMERTIVPAIFAFLVNIARELIKDIEDREGDEKEHAVTFPIRYGTRPSIILASLSLIFLIGATWIVIYQSIYRDIFTPLVLCSDLLIGIALFAMWRGSSPSVMNRVSTLLKAAMIIGLAAIIFGSI